MIKRVVWVFLFLIATINVNAEVFYLDGQNVSFDAPDGFTELSNEEISFKFPSNRAPQFVVGNETRTTTIAYDWKQDRLSMEDLPQFKEAMEPLLERIIPGIQWKKKEIISINGRDFIYFELISSAVDTDIYNIMLMTSYQDRMLAFNLNSTVADFEIYEDFLRDTIETIMVRE